MSVVFARALCVLALAATASAYQFPIAQQAPIFNQRNQDNNQIQEVQRRLESVEARQFEQPAGPKSAEEEAQQLRQLHQVVDTMAQMLNEEEQREDVSQNSPLPKNYQRELQPQSELMSESAIRQAIEQLEQASQIDRSNQNQFSAPFEAESRSSPMLAELVSSQSPSPIQKQEQQHAASLESLIEELGDDLLSERLLTGPQDAERLVKVQVGSDRNQDKNAHGSTITATDTKKLDTHDTVGPSELKILQEQQVDNKRSHVSTSREPKMIGQLEQQRQEQNSSTMSSLFIGQLNSQETDLGSSLTNDFYTFHEQPASNAENSNQQSIAADIPNEPTKQELRAQLVSSDLDLAAQTRNSVSQRDAQPNIRFGREEGTIRFDFTQPVPVEAPLAQTQQQARIPVNTAPNHESHIRAARQHPSPPSLDSSPFTTSTLLPNPDGFWRPSENFGQNVGSGDINQHYSRARISQENFPSLPQSRFQSIGPPNQALQPVVPSRQTSHTHFTGHSFLPTNPTQNQFQTQGLLAQNRDKNMASTSQPLISVLAGADTAGVGNSVSWNPPPNLGGQTAAQAAQNINQPSQPAFSPINQLAITSTQAPQTFNDFSTPPQQVFPNSSPRSPLPSQIVNLAQFNSQFQAPANNRFINLDNSRELRSRPTAVLSSTEFSNAAEVTTEERLEPPTTSTQWVSSSSFAPAPTERDTSDSRPHSSVRSLADDGRAHNSPLYNGIESTQASNIDIPRTEPPRSSRIATTTTTVPTTLRAPTAPGLPINNSTKKEDMVIYYYYYYDDNKNATVVAKNISADHNGANLPLDTALEADGGIEDTPYMDDPIPPNQPKVAPVVPSTSTSTLATMTTTTSATTPTSLVGESIFEENNRSRFSSNSGRIPVVNDPQSFSRSSTEKVPSREELRGSAGRPIYNDQFRTNMNQNMRASAQGSSRQNPAEQSEPNAPLPYNVPTSTSASRARLQTQELSSSNRVSTESTVTRTPPGARSELAIQRISTPTMPNSKIQTDLISSVLNGVQVQNSQNRIQTSTTTVPTPVNSNSGNNRGPLSNASRYGTSSNLMLDPYGLDPAAPASFSVPSHSQQINASSSHNRNWNQHLTPPGSSHQFNRKPSSAVTNNISSQSMASINIGKEQRAQITNQSKSGVSTPTTASKLLDVVTHSSIADLKSTTIGSRSSTVQSVPSSGSARQFYPETSSPPQPIDRFSSDRIASPLLKQNIADETILKQKEQVHHHRLVSSSELGSNSHKEATQRPPMISNGRPLTVEGNTGNGFTKSSIQSTSVTPQPLENVNEQIQDVTDNSFKLPASTTTIQPTSSTSITRSFTNPQGQVTTSSVSLPTVTTSSVTTTITRSTSNSESASQLPATSSTSSSASSSSSSSSNTVAPDANLTSESPESANLASSRKRFGNRNNRFQTRLSSLSSANLKPSSTSTPAPSSTTTTRRPTSTTTRKSSKQLFAGRRRLGTTQADVEVSSSTSSNIASSSSSASSTSTSLDVGSSTSAPSRARFGNSFTSRARTTASSIQNQEQNDSTPKPSLFGSQQRASSKPRLPFLRSTKPATTQTLSSSDGSNSSSLPLITESVVQDSSTVGIDKSTTEKALLSSDVIKDKLDEVIDDGNNRLNESDLTERKEIAPVVPNSPVEAPTGSLAASVPLSSSNPASASNPEPTSGRAKPKVRPLFASRQRNSPLFGNRRNNGTVV